MDFSFSNLKHLILSHLTLILTVFIGICVSTLSFIFTKNIQLDIYFSDALPTHFFQIFIHNLTFLIIFSIPFIGHVYYMYSFLIIFVAIGMHVNHLGLFNTLGKLWHLPIEVYAFSLIIDSSFKPIKKRIKPILTATLCLLISAIIEFYI